MTIRSLLGRLRRRTRHSGFEPAAYWERRHRTYAGRLIAVGHAKLSENANAEQYGIKRREISALLRKYFPISAGHTLLDAGCGTGDLSEFFERMGYEVTGVDFSETAIRQARERGLAAKFTVVDLRFLDLQRRFDVVMAVDVLFHVTEEQRWSDSIRVLARHLDAHGVLVILDHFRDDFGVGGGHCHFRPFERYQGALAESGLVILEHRRVELPYEDGPKNLLVAGVQR